MLEKELLAMILKMILRIAKLKTILLCYREKTEKTFKTLFFYIEKKLG